MGGTQAPFSSQGRAGRTNSGGTQRHKVPFSSRTIKGPTEGGRDRKQQNNSPQSDSPHSPALCSTREVQRERRTGAPELSSSATGECHPEWPRGLILGHPGQLSCFPGSSDSPRPVSIRVEGTALKMPRGPRVQLP